MTAYSNSSSVSLNVLSDWVFFPFEETGACHSAVPFAADFSIRSKILLAFFFSLPVK